MTWHTVCLDGASNMNNHKNSINMKNMLIKRIIRNSVSFPIILLALSLSGCATAKKMAISQVGNALAAGGTSFTSDDDPELVKAAIPFSLKMMDSLLAEVPRHRGLLYAASSGYTQYGYAFVQLEAERMEDHDLEAYFKLRNRAKRLYLRGRDYGLSGLEVKHRNFKETLRADPAEAVKNTKKRDVPLLYWTAASWAAAIAISIDDPDLIGDLPMVEALIDRALQLDESYDYGAIHGFLIALEYSRMGVSEDPEVRVRRHFDRAVELSGAQLASPFVALAETVSIPNQNRDEFQELLNRALSIDVDARPEWRLVNLIYQDRARWLLGRTDRFFLN